MYTAHESSGQGVMARKSLGALLGWWSLSKWPLHCGNGKNTDGLDVCCIGSFKKWLTLAQEAMTSALLWKSYMLCQQQAGLQSSNAGACLRTTQTLGIILEVKRSSVNLLFPYFQQISDYFRSLIKITIWTQFRTAKTCRLFQCRQKLKLPMCSSWNNYNFSNQVRDSSCFPH